MYQTFENFLRLLTFIIVNSSKTFCNSNMFQDKNKCYRNYFTTKCMKYIQTCIRGCNFDSRWDICQNANKRFFLSIIDKIRNKSTNNNSTNISKNFYKEKESFAMRPSPSCISTTIFYNIKVNKKRNSECSIKLSFS